MKFIFAFSLLIVCSFALLEASAQGPSRPSRPSPKAPSGTLLGGSANSSNSATYDIATLKWWAEHYAAKRCESGEATRSGAWDIRRETGRSSGSADCQTDSSGRNHHCTYDPPKDWVVIEVSAFFYCR